MPHNLPIWLRGVGVGCLMAATSICGLAYMYFHPEKRMSDMFTNNQYKRILVGLAVFGTLLAIADLVLPDK
jgi:hypothetical protein